MPYHSTPKKVFDAPDPNLWRAAPLKMGSPGRPYRTLTIEGFTVLVGKGDAQNDSLTFRVAEPRDFWMHVAGAPGSHVVVRNPDGLHKLPRSVRERAAALAAWYSKARHAWGKVEVHVCRVADVSKPRGFAPGEVRLRGWDSLRVYPAELGAENGVQSSEEAGDDPGRE